MGVYAGTDLVDKISAATVALNDQDYLPVMLLSLPDRIPDRSAFALGADTSVNPGEVVAAQVKVLAAAGCRICGIACNTFHLDRMYQHVRQVEDVDLVSIVDTTCLVLESNTSDVGAVAVLGTRGTMNLGLYESRLRDLGVPTVPVPTTVADKVSEAIRAVPNGLKIQALRPSREAVENVVQAVEGCREVGADTVVLGCTELPFVLRDETARRRLAMTGLKIVDPAQLLARELVRRFAPSKLAAGSWHVALD